MESSESSVSSDWEVVNQTEISEEVKEEPSVEINSNGMNEVKECSPTGSGVQVFTEEDINHHNDNLNEANVDYKNDISRNILDDIDIIREMSCHPPNILSELNVNHHNQILSETDVSHHEILNDTSMNHHNDSNSSSDIDVIEEGAEEMHHSGMLLSQIDLLSTTLAESGPLVPTLAPASAPNTEDGWNRFLLTHRLLRNPQFKDCLIIIFISIAVASTMHLQGTPEDKIKQMKEQVDELKKENTHLKDRVISKIEDDKLFQTLEEQINALKTENVKLSNSMQFLIIYLEEQTESLKNENKIKEQDPYKTEIDKLKEQVNLLKIDNDDLQQQLVRMRYGAFSPLSENAKDDSGKKDAKLDQKEDAKENSSDILTEEIEKLKNKLYSEVNDLKDWKESIDNLVKELNEKENKGHEDDFFKSKKASEDEQSRKHKEETHGKKKNEKFYDWTWKDFRGSFDSMNIADMLSKYVNYNEKKVKEAFEGVGKYFKKAQEKTRNMFKHYNNNGKNEFWDFLGSLRHKWANMKDEFYESQRKEGPKPPKHAESNFASDFSEKPPKFENEKKKSTRWVNNIEQQSIKNGEPNSVVDYLMKSARMKQLIGSDPVWRERFRKFLEEEILLWDHGKEPENSWMFRRAAIRSILREHEDKEDSTNWFLRRKKTRSEEGSGLRKEEDDLIN